MTAPDGTGWYSVAEAARLLGLKERAVRKRIAAGTLHAERAGGGPWRVRLPAPASAPSGTAAGTSAAVPSGRPAPLEGTFSPIGESPAVALVPLAAVADQLQGLADRLADLAERNEGLALELGQLRERTATQAAIVVAKDEAIAELRREVEALRRQASPQPASAATTPPPPPATPDAPAPAGGFWRRLRRVFGGEG